MCSKINKREKKKKRKRLEKALSFSNMERTIDDAIYEPITWVNMMYNVCVKYHFVVENNNNKKNEIEEIDR